MSPALQLDQSSTPSPRDKLKTRAAASNSTQGLRVALATRIPNLRAFGRCLCLDEALADDLVLETLLTAWRDPALFRDRSNLKVRLFTILRNIYLSRRGRDTLGTNDAVGKIANQSSVPAEHPVSIDLLDIRGAFAKLPASQREALILVDAEGFSYEEAASICDCTVNAVKSRVERARLCF